MIQFPEKEKRIREHRCLGCGRILKPYNVKICDICQEEMEYLLQAEQKSDKEWLKKTEQERDKIWKKWQARVEKEEEMRERAKEKLRQKYGAAAPYHYGESEHLS